MSLLLATWESSMAATSVVSNQQHKAQDTVYVSCSANWAYEISKHIPPVSKISIPLPPITKGTVGILGTTGTNWPLMVYCVVKYNEVSQHWQFLYSSLASKDNQLRKNKCFVKLQKKAFSKGTRRSNGSTFPLRNFNPSLCCPFQMKVSQGLVFLENKQDYCESKVE